jgi:hypothetical protein
MLFVLFSTKRTKKLHIKIPGAGQDTINFGHFEHLCVSCVCVRVRACVCVRMVGSVNYGFGVRVSMCVFWPPANHSLLTISQFSEECSYILKVRVELFHQLDQKREIYNRTFRK